MMAMIGYDSNLHNLTNDDFMVAGAVAGTLTRLLCQPLDVVKIRFQLQVESLSRHDPAAKYHGLVHCTRTIVKEEGAKALWKGHVSAQLLSIIYGAVAFSSFEFLTKEVFVRKPSMKDFAPVNFVCGGASNGLATLVSYPFDTIRTRFIGQGNPPVYSGVFNCVSTIIRVEGFRSLYRGLVPTVVQIVPHGGAQFALYNGISKLMKQNELFVLDSSYTVKDRKKYLTPLGSFLAGGFAGAGAKIVIYPLDLAKKRLQIQGEFNNQRQGFGKKFICTGVMNCLAETYRNEKFAGLFKGVYPTLIKAALSTSLHFAFYEQTIFYLARNKNTKVVS